ncbi:2-oxo-4-hydroxy-4-carboxy-5-ureidoimidazoline decarboxylase-like isoform X3 [Vanessa atalanta]|uniref:2-oxo-4-hydroxy-4-carboxy-5-ureidoimidazoline decarboxylase-like isoform X3 n=1 Tax=Vanessa atalanta TaxID=42275 RepID=UPI001FCD3444|nr:2-oxo-4-hydroxy-4-carboxy-5-ureidoimidazoline decarboxylase-like isoform X3 [Vanessa atalanta]
MEGLISISEVNSMNDERFEWVFRNVIELCSEAAAHVKHMRPFKDVTDLCAAFSKYLNEVSYEAAQVELTQESASEQHSAGLSDLSNAQKAIIDSSNKRYKEKFGFPFIICARENKVQSIIDGLNLRYGNTRDEEINIGINEVKKICKLRILDIVKNE